MYHIFLGIQLAGIAVLFVEFFYLFHARQSRDQMLLIVFDVFCAVNALGYLFEMLARSRDTAILAVKFSYIGKIFVPFMIMLFVMDFCKIVVPKWVQRILLIMHGAVLLLVLTCERNQLFYSSIEYVYDGMFPHLVLQHGIVYNLYLVMLLIYMIIMPGACLYRYKRVSAKQEKHLLLMLGVIVLMPMAGFFVFLTNVTQGYDTTALCYAISSLCFLITIWKHNILDVVDIAKDELVENLSEGMIVFDNNIEFVFANAAAEVILSDWDIKNHSKSANKRLQEWEQSQKPRKVANRYYEPSNQAVMDGSKVRGIMWTLHDVTDSYRYTYQLEEDVKKKTQEIQKIQHKVIISLAKLIGVRDDDTGNHVNRTSGIVEILVKELKKTPAYSVYLSSGMVQDIVDAAPLHDIGKIAIPDNILCKPGKLTPEEYEIIKTHASVGGKMLEEVLSGVENDRYLSVAASIAYYHHERWDGKGYPKGLQGTDIPLPARIMAVSDVYDALVSKRAYKEAMPFEEAFQIITEGAGTQFDAVIVDIFVKKFDDIKALYQKYSD